MPKEMKIEKLVADVTSLLPIGWTASRCMGIDMMGGHSPEMVIVMRRGMREALIATPIAGRLAYKKKWFAESREGAAAIAALITNAHLGSKVVIDGGTVYVKP